MRGRAIVSGNHVCRVLVVDDKGIVRGVIARALKTMGCEVTEAPDADSAIAAFLTMEFDLITLDYRMPGLDGMAFHKVLSQEFGAGRRTTGFALRRLPPIILITAYDEEPEIIRGQFGEGIVGVLKKPFNVQEFMRLVEFTVGDEVSRGRPGSEGRQRCSPTRQLVAGAF